MLIQNFLGTEIEFSPSDKKTVLKIAQLDKKKIQAMYLLAGNFEDQLIYLPTREVYIDDVQSTNGDFFLNMVDIKGETVVKNLSFNHLISVLGANLFDYSINRLIDIEKSYISYSNFQFTTVRNFIYLLNVIYQTQNFEPFNDDINGIVDIDIYPDLYYQDIRLDTVVKNKLAGKKIKRILANIPSGEAILLSSYLDLYCFSGKRIENIPTLFLNKRGQQAIYFDNLDIDWENSYFRQRGYCEPEYGRELAKVTLTFIY